MFISIKALIFYSLYPFIQIICVLIYGLCHNFSLNKPLTPIKTIILYYPLYKVIIKHDYLKGNSEIQKMEYYEVCVNVNNY